MKSERQAINVVLPIDDLDRLDKQAVLQDKSRAEILREAIRLYDLVKGRRIELRDPAGHKLEVL